VKLNKCSEAILQKYEQVFSLRGLPPEMFEIPPAIPFIGNMYHDKNPKVLSYASAENLTYAYNDDFQPLDSKIHYIGTKGQFIRSRYFYDEHPGNFPHVHIEPFNNGTQLLITRHILSKLGHNEGFGIKPYEFVEQISVANPGKFSVASKNNQDYASDTTKISYSLEYIQEDLRILKPNIIILPRTVFNTVNKISNWKCLLSEAKISTAIFVKIYQVSFYNNYRIRKAVKELRPSNRNVHEYSNWIDLMDNRNIDIDSYLSWIDNELFERELVSAE